MYAKVPREEARRLGAKVITTKWVDTNKGSEKEPNYRSRLVGKEFNAHKDLSISAATPPLEALMFLVGRAATMDGVGEGVVGPERGKKKECSTWPIRSGVENPLWNHTLVWLCRKGTRYASRIALMHVVDPCRTIWLPCQRLVRTVDV